MAWRRPYGLACLSLCAAFGPAADAEHFARCAACHLDDGRGVPGMFPPIAGHVDRFFPSAEGRAYLGRLVAGGASGTVRIAGVRYAGVVPAVVADLSDGEVADLLNELTRRFATSAVPPFSAEDVAIARRAGPLSGAERGALRERALAAGARR